MPDTPGRQKLTDSLARELHKLAARQMKKERDGHTLQTTAIVNEAWLRLQRSPECNDRKHFLALAARVMRQVLVDYARARSAGKRAAVFVTLEETAPADDASRPEVLDIHDALEEMSEMAPRQAQLVELRFFGGLPIEEAADVLGISRRTAVKDWALARAWLRRRLTSGEARA